jgi:hypothetical protein
MEDYGLGMFKKVHILDSLFSNVILSLRSSLAKKNSVKIDLDQDRSPLPKDKHYRSHNAGFFPVC